VYAKGFKSLLRQTNGRREVKAAERVNLIGVEVTTVIRTSYLMLLTESSVPKRSINVTVSILPVVEDCHVALRVLPK